MCIIASKPEGLVLSNEVLHNMWNRNSDGAGFMYVEDGKLHVVKGLMTFKDFTDAYEPHKEKKAVLHFRIRTHGKTDEANTHPFFISDDLAFAHNGTITGFGSQSHSDTWHFNEELLKDLYLNSKNFLEIASIKKLLEDRIGWSKLVFMDKNNNVTILNENKGNYSSDGVWFSNDGWKTVEPKTYPKYQPQYRGNFLGNSTHQSTDTQQKTSPTMGGYSHIKPLRVGSICRVISDIGAFKNGDLVYVVSIIGTGSYSCQRIDADLENHPCTLGGFYLQEVYIGEIKQKVGHLDIGDTIAISSIVNDIAYCRQVDFEEGGVMNKVYSVPAKHIRVLESLEAAMTITQVYHPQLVIEME